MTAPRVGADIGRDKAMQGLLTQVFTIFGTALSVGGGAAGLWEGWQAAKAFRDGDGSRARDSLIGVIMGLAGIAIGLLVTRIPGFMRF